MGHGLFIVSAIDGHGIAGALHRLTQAGHVAVTEDCEYAVKQALRFAIYLHILRAEVSM